MTSRLSFYVTSAFWRLMSLLPGTSRHHIDQGRRIQGSVRNATETPLNAHSEQKSRSMLMQSQLFFQQHLPRTVNTDAMRRISSGAGLRLDPLRCPGQKISSFRTPSEMSSSRCLILMCTVDGLPLVGLVSTNLHVTFHALEHAREYMFGPTKLAGCDHIFTMSRGLKNGNPKIRLTTQTTSLVIKKPYRASLKQSDTFKTPNSFIMQFFSSATIFLAAMAGVAVAAPVDTPASKVDARSASEMLSARDIKLVREILSSSETFQNAVAKREVDEREIPVYIIFTYAE